MTDSTTPRYDRRRDSDAGTYGGAHRSRKRAPKVFAGGAQYALDVLLREMRGLPINAEDWALIDLQAERVLRAAQTTEPLP